MTDQMQCTFERKILGRQKIKDIGVQDGIVKFGIRTNIKIFFAISKLEDQDGRVILQECRMKGYKKVINWKFLNTRPVGKPKQDGRTSFGGTHHRSQGYEDGGTSRRQRRLLREARAKKELQRHKRNEQLKLILKTCGITLWYYNLPLPFHLIHRYIIYTAKITPLNAHSTVLCLREHGG